MIIDSHCHLFDEKLVDIKEEIISSLEKDNQICVCSGCDIESSKESLELAKSNNNIFATVGTHPENAMDFKDEDLKVYEEMCKNPKVVAIGEIGLDYYYEVESKEKQKEVLRKQIIFADKMNLPCVFHVRSATQDFLDMVSELQQYFRNSSVVHSFSGSVDTAKILTKKGFYLGINGISTFKNANKILDVIREIPLEHLLIETDSPYLAPVPFRGKNNQPKYVYYVAQKIAELKEISVEEVINQTTENAKKLFKLGI